MEFNHVIGKTKFQVICDKDSILQTLESEREAYEGDIYVAFRCTDDDGYLGKEEYLKNVEEISETLDDWLKEDSLIGFIEKAQKKKSGTFYKGRVIDTKGSGNCIYFTEWHNTWAYNELKVKAISDTVLKITYVNKNDTPGY